MGKCTIFLIFLVCAFIIAFVIILLDLLVIAEKDETVRCKALSITTASGFRARNGEYCPGDLIFVDNFNYFDVETWNHEITLAGDGNSEFQYYTNNRSNSYVENRQLYIRPTLLANDYNNDFLYNGLLNIQESYPVDACTNQKFAGCERKGTLEKVLNPVKSARIRTVNSFSFRYGKLEISAKMPSGDWIFPTISLLPKSNFYGEWPCSGEIKLFESRGNLNYTMDNIHVGVEQIASSLNFGPLQSLYENKKTKFVKNIKPNSSFNKNFHKYQMEWTPDSIKFSVDDEEIGKITGNLWDLGMFEETIPNIENPWKFGQDIAPFDQKFYLVIRLSVGGLVHFPDDAVNYPSSKPWKNDDSNAVTKFWLSKNDWLSSWNLEENFSKESSLVVNYVRVWAL